MGKKRPLDDQIAPMDAALHPLARYTKQGDNVVVTATNDRFEAAFAERQSIRAWWDANDVRAQSVTVDELVAIMRAGDPVNITIEVGQQPTQSKTYHFSTTPVSNGDTDGYLAISTEPASGEWMGGDQIASVISHDLRNPLDVAKARARAAEETGEQEHFERLHGAHDRMEQIIQDVLTLARGDGALSQSHDVAIETIARDAWETVDTGQATVTVADDLPTVEADSDRLQRLFENLFRNSLEHGVQRDQSASADTHTPDTENVVSVRVGRTEDGFFVADDGTGIPSDKKEQVFEPGYSRKDGGTGLGLTIVDRIADAHGWTVTLTTSVDGGARFEFGVTGNP